MKIKSILGLLLLWLPALAWAEITAEGAWVRLPPPEAEEAVAYLTLRNSGGDDVQIISVESDAGAGSEFQSIIFLEGNVLTQKIGAVIVPAHGRLRLTSGGTHLLLKKLKRELGVGDHVALKLNTSDGRVVEVSAEVRGRRQRQN